MMIKYTFKFHDLKCSKEVARAIYNQHGDDAEVTFNDAGTAAVIHSPFCIERKEQRLAELKAKEDKTESEEKELGNLTGRIKL